MKIIYIIDSLNIGGKERQLIELLKGILKHQDIKIELVVLSDKIEYKYIFDLKIKIHILKRQSKNDFKIFVKLWRIINKFKPDIIHSWELMCSVYAIPIAKIKNIKIINGIIRYAPQNFNIFNTKGFILTKLTFILSDINLSNSYAGLRSFNISRGKSYCIHNGFDIDRIGNIVEKEKIKMKFNITTENIVGMVARFHKRKDYISYIKSAINILQTKKNVTFLTVGDGDTYNECLNEVPSKYKDYIRFLGNQKDVESIVNIFDVGVLSSYEEGISNSIMEYMSLGKPVVATNHGGNNEIVEDNVTGFLVKTNDINGLTEKINILLSNKHSAGEMGKNGKDRLEKEFSVKKMTDAHMKLYKSLA